MIISKEKPIYIDYCPLCGSQLGNDIKHKILPNKRNYLSMRLRCPKQKATVDILVLDS